MEENRRGAEGAEPAEDLVERVRARYNSRDELPPRFNEISQRVIGAAIEVHRELGPGFLEAFYEEAMCVELLHRGIRFERQAGMSVEYKGCPIGTARADLIVEDLVVVELKAVESILPIHRAQILSYMRAASIGLGLLINFNVRLLRDGIIRMVQSANLHSAETDL